MHPCLLRSAAPLPIAANCVIEFALPTGAYHPLAVKTGQKTIDSSRTVAIESDIDKETLMVMPSATIWYAISDHSCPPD